MHYKKNGLYWIEAEEFDESNFITLSERISFVRYSSSASGENLVIAFQKSGQFLEYIFREEIDGLREYGLWMRYATRCPASEINVSVNEVPVGRKTLPDTGDFFSRYRWEKITSVRIPKGVHRLRITLLNGVIHPDLIVLSETDEPVRSGAVEKSIVEKKRNVVVTSEPANTDRLWRQNERNGVPLGGLGTGKIEICMDGSLSNITVNNNQDAPVACVPGSFFVYREKKDESKAIVKLLKKTGGKGEIEELLYKGEYPSAFLQYRDSELCARLSLKTFSPLVPYDVRSSTIPAAVFIFTLENPTEEPLKSIVGFSWENIVGCGGLGAMPEFGPGTALKVEGQSFWAWNDRNGNDQEPIVTAEGAGLCFFGLPDAGYVSSRGEYVLLCGKSHGVRVSTTRSYNVEEDLPRLIEYLPDEIPEDMREGERGVEGKMHPAGIVWGECLLKPGEKKEIVFCLSWHFPHYCDRYGNDSGIYYANFFRNPRESADRVLKDRDILLKRSRAVIERIAGSSLPDWLSSKIINDLFPLASCSWFDRNGNFSVNEAPSQMHGCLGTIDQRTVSQGPYAILFPELDRKELSLFASFQNENGQIPHDLGRGAVSKEDAQHLRWPDLSCSFIIQCHRLVHLNGDKGFASSVMPVIIKAVEWAVTLDDDGDGVPDMKAGRGNTYDDTDWQGCSSFIASMWIAGLLCAADLACICGLNEYSERYKDMADCAARTMEEKLWNGEFYRNFISDDIERKDGEYCVLPQVAGEWALDLADIESPLEASRVKRALQNIYIRNIKGKEFKAPADEVTEEGKPAFAGTSFLQYSWIYFGALAAYRGLADQASACWRQGYEISWNINRQSWKTYLTAYALSGRFNGLPWYMTNTGSWYIMNAVSGFAYSLVDGWLKIDPHLPSEWCDKSSCECKLSMPLFGSGFWLDLEYRDVPGRKRFSIRNYHPFDSKPVFRSFRTAIPAAASVNRILLNGSPCRNFRHERESGRVTIELADGYDTRSDLLIEIDYRHLL